MIMRILSLKIDKNDEKEMNSKILSSNTFLEFIGIDLFKCFFLIFPILMAPPFRDKTQPIPPSDSETIFCGGIS